MTKLEAIIRPNRFDQVKEALGALGVEGMTVSEVAAMAGKKARRKRTAAASMTFNCCPN